jgi:hypothetical protein
MSITTRLGLCSRLFASTLHNSRQVESGGHRSRLAWRWSSSVPSPERTLPPKQSLFTRFKTMYKDYWYVLVPVHVVTSLGWIGGFYYFVKR